jgi:hypothetical protein
MRMILLLLVVAAAPVVALRGAHAQSAPLSGVDGERLRLGTDSMAIYLVRGSDTVPTGAVWDELSRRTEGNGVTVLQRVYRSRDRVLGERVDTVVDQPGTLAPIRLRSRTARSQEFLDFADQRVIGWLRLANGDSVAVDESLPAMVYNSSSFDLVLRSAPLSEGWSAEVPAFLASTRRVLPLRARVDALERIGGEPCWRVEAEFVGMPVTFWIHEQSRALCQQVMQVNPDTQVLFRRTFPTSRQPPRQRA